MGLDIYHVTPAPKEIRPLEYFTIDELQDSPDFFEKHKHLINFIDNPYEKQIPVIYYEEKGHQLKSMNAEFVSVFENDKLYFDIETVKKAKLFIEAKPDVKQEELEQAFQTNFIDNFVVGESVFFISW